MAACNISASVAVTVSEIMLPCYSHDVHQMYCTFNALWTCPPWCTWHGM